MSLTKADFKAGLDQAMADGEAIVTHARTPTKIVQIEDDRCPAEWSYGAMSKAYNGPTLADCMERNWPIVDYDRNTCRERTNYEGKAGESYRLPPCLATIDPAAEEALAAILRQPKHEIRWDRNGHLIGMYPMAAPIVDVQFVTAQIQTGSLLPEESAEAVKVAVEHEFMPLRSDIDPISYSFGFWLDHPEELGEALDAFHATYTACGWVSEPKLTEATRREKDGRFTKAKRIVFKVYAQRVAR